MSPRTKLRQMTSAIEPPITFTITTVEPPNPLLRTFTIETVKRRVPRPMTFTIEAAKQPMPRPTPKKAKR